MECWERNTAIFQINLKSKKKEKNGTNSRWTEGLKRGKS